MEPPAAVGIVLGGSQSEVCGLTPLCTQRLACLEPLGDWRPWPSGVIW